MKHLDSNMHVSRLKNCNSSFNGQPHQSDCLYSFGVTATHFWPKEGSYAQLFSLSLFMDFGGFGWILQECYFLILLIVVGCI